MSSSDDDDFVDLTQQDDDDDAFEADAAPAPKKKPATKKAPAAKPPAEGTEPAAPGGDASKKKPAAPKKPAAQLKHELPLVLTNSSAREGKNTLLLELDSKAGGFGVDTGAIGRASFPRVEGRRQFRLDLRGQEYDATMRPCPTMLVVHAAGDEAKIEAVLSEYVTLKHTRDARADRGYAAGDFDDGYRVYAGDVNVNARSRKRAGTEDSGGSDSDAPAAKKTKAAKPKARKPAKRKPAKPAKKKE